MFINNVVSIEGAASKSGIQVGDFINSYNGTKCISYYQLMDTIDNNINNSKIDLEIVRGTATIHKSVPGGRLGIGLEEGIKK
jgi:hypothetical protein